jgi:hypothetical protein
MSLSYIAHVIETASVLPADTETVSERMAV